MYSFYLKWFDFFFSICYCCVEKVSSLWAATQRRGLYWFCVAQLSLF